MIDPKSQQLIGEEIKKRLVEDKALLDELRKEILSLKGKTVKIQPRTTTAISLVGTDGGNNRLQFDPFMVQVVRVVDSSNNEYVLEAVTPSTDVDALSKNQFDSKGKPITALGEMMEFLKVTKLPELTHMIRVTEKNKPASPTWIQVYRELVEWAILFHIIRKKDFGTDTIIVFDGLLRSKVFAGDLFKKLIHGIWDEIENIRNIKKRNIFVTGVAKHSKVLSRYRLVMALEKVMMVKYPCYLEIPREIEEKAYVWSEYAKGSLDEKEGAEISKFVGGKMFFVKFGGNLNDPIWPVDVLEFQKDKASAIIGYMLADAINGFPVPFYPLCLQKAHENAALVDFDFDILQDQIYKAIRSVVGDGQALDAFMLHDEDPASKRY